MSLNYVKWNSGATIEIVHLVSAFSSRHCVWHYRKGARSEYHRICSVKLEAEKIWYNSWYLQGEKNLKKDLITELVSYKMYHNELENIKLSLRGFVRRFYVSSLEEIRFRRNRQCSWNETDALKLTGNCERNFDSAFSSSCKTTFFWVKFGQTEPGKVAALPCDLENSWNAIA